MLLRELESLNSDFMVRHLSRTSIVSVRTRRNQRRFIYLVRSTMPYSSSSGHVASVLFPELPSLPDIPPDAGSPSSQEVKAGCTCPAWRYWGPAYNSTSERYNLPDQKQTVAPRIRDPGLENKACKHVVKVIRHMKRRTFEKLLGDFNIARNASLMRPALTDCLVGMGEFGMVRELESTPDIGLEDLCEDIGVFP